MLPPLPLLLMFSLPHKLFLFGLRQNPSQTYFLLQSGLPAGDGLFFGISGSAAWIEAFGTVLGTLCVSRKHYQGWQCVCASTATSPSPQLLAFSPAAAHCPQREEGVPVGLYYQYRPQAHYLSPLLPIFTFPCYQQKYFFSMAALFCVLLSHPPSRFSLQFINCLWSVLTSSYC